MVIGKKVKMSAYMIGKSFCFCLLDNIMLLRMGFPWIFVKQEAENLISLQFSLHTIFSVLFCLFVSLQINMFWFNSHENLVSSISFVSKELLIQILSLCVVLCIYILFQLKTMYILLICTELLFVKRNQGTKNNSNICGQLCK